MNLLTADSHVNRAEMELNGEDKKHPIRLHDAELGEFLASRYDDQQPGGPVRCGYSFAVAVREDESRLTIRHEAKIIAPHAFRVGCASELMRPPRRFHLG